MVQFFGTLPSEIISTLTTWLHVKVHVYANNPQAVLVSQLAEALLEDRVAIVSQQNCRAGVLQETLPRLYSFYNIGSYNVSSGRLVLPRSEYIHV